MDSWIYGIYRSEDLGGTLASNERAGSFLFNLFQTLALQLVCLRTTPGKALRRNNNFVFAGDTTDIQTNKHQHFNPLWFESSDLEENFTGVPRHVLAIHPRGGPKFGRLEGDGNGSRFALNLAGGAVASAYNIYS